MSLEEAKNAAGQERPARRQELVEALHELLVRELRNRESAASPGEKAPRSTLPQKEHPQTVGGAITTLVLAIAVPRLIGLAIWGSIYNEPHWWDVGSAALMIAGILGVITALKNRPSGT